MLELNASCSKFLELGPHISDLKRQDPRRSDCFAGPFTEKDSEAFFIVQGDSFVCSPEKCC